MGLYLEVFTEDLSARSIVKISHSKYDGLLLSKVLWAEPGAFVAGIAAMPDENSLDALFLHYNTNDIVSVYKIKSKLELTRLLLMVEWQKPSDAK